MTKTIGLDISKAKIDVAILADEEYNQAQFSNDKDGFRRLRKWLKKHKGLNCHACLEATGRYGDAVAEYLHAQGHPVSVVNPARIKAYGRSQLRRNKTDSEDAKLIAHFCLTQRPTLWQPPAPEVKELQALTRHLQTLKEDRVRLINRRGSGVVSETVLASLNNHIAFLDSQIAALSQQIDDHIGRHPDLKHKRDLLVSIPGIADTTAALFIAEVPDVSRFDTASQLTAYAGLCPRQHLSGSSVHRRARLTKTGSVRFRTIFYFPALSAIRFNPIVRALAARLTARGKHKMCIVGAAMRKLVHLSFGVLKSGLPFDPHFQSIPQLTP